MFPLNILNLQPVALMIIYNSIRMLLKYLYKVNIMQATHLIDCIAVQESHSIVFVMNQVWVYNMILNNRLVVESNTGLA